MNIQKYRYHNRRRIKRLHPVPSCRIAEEQREARVQVGRPQGDDERVTSNFESHQVSAVRGIRCKAATPNSPRERRWPIELRISSVPGSGGTIILAVATDSFSRTVVGFQTAFLPAGMTALGESCRDNAAEHDRTPGS